MSFVLRLLYGVAARMTSAVAGLIPASDSKTAVAIRARRGIGERYTAWASEFRDRSRPLLWMHAPSVGEGLQARPVLTLMRAKRPDAQLAYTFFSPSAEEFSRSLDVDFRDYLPFDIPRDMRVALEALAPRALVFSKLDVWPQLVREAHNHGVRVGMISATLAARSSRRGRVARVLLGDAYKLLDAVGAVDASDADRLVELGVRREVIEVTGDTRFDQVWQRSQAVDRSSGLLARLASRRPTVVAGSTWPSDEAVLLEAFAATRESVRGARLIIAPHETDHSHLKPIQRWARHAELTLAHVDDISAADADVVLVDRFGVLGELYSLAQVAFVGGGFHSAGLHSVLEPAAFGVPVLFGPQHHRSRDAALLIAAGAARSVENAVTVTSLLTGWLGDSAQRLDAGGKARRVITENLGAADRSLALVERLLT